MCRWLLSRIQGVFVLRHVVVKEQVQPLLTWSPLRDALHDPVKRGRQLVLTMLPYLSGLLSPTASVHLDMRSSTMPNALVPNLVMHVQSTNKHMGTVSACTTSVVFIQRLSLCGEGHLSRKSMLSLLMYMIATVPNLMLLFVQSRHRPSSEHRTLILSLSTGVACQQYSHTSNSPFLGIL